MTGQVKFFNDQMTGADALTGAAGKLIPVLDSCLVNGFNQSNVTSISVTSGVATVTVASGHGFDLRTVVLVEGASPSGLNGEKPVTGVTSSTVFTFDATGVADGSATGTITVKVAPLGWTKEFSGTNLAVYRTPSVSNTRKYLRVDDTSTRSARVVGYETMSDVDTGTDRFPTATQHTDGFWWHRSNLTSTGDRRWYIIGDDDRFYIGIYHRDDPPPAAIQYGASVGFFGDIIPFRPGDAYHCMLCGAYSSSATSTFPASTFPGVGRPEDTLSNLHMVLARDNSQISISEPSFASPYPPTTNLVFNNIVTGNEDFEVEYPSASDGGLLFSTNQIYEFTPGLPRICRGELPGMKFIHSQSPLNDGDVINGAPGAPGREILLKHYGNLSGGSDGRIGFDLTGPWD